MLGVLYMVLFFGALIGAVIFIQKKLMKSKKFEKLIGLHPKDPSKENSEKKIDLVRVFDSGMSWFSWIAGLSFINTFLIISNTGWSFIFGLTATQFLDYSWYFHFSEYLLLDLVISIILYVCILGSITLAGFLSKRRYIWAMWVGLILITLDGWLSLYVEDYWGVAFHAFVIFRVVNGYMALRRAHKDDKDIPIKNQFGRQKLKFSAYLVLNIIIIFFFWASFLYSSEF